MAGADFRSARISERELGGRAERSSSAGKAENCGRLYPGDLPADLPGHRLHFEVLDNGEIFLPRLFQGFPEIKEALISNKVQAAFIVAPLAIALVAQGVPIKVVYLGHRYGSAVVVQKNGPVKTFADLRGRVVAIPSRFSDERLMLFRAMKAWGLKPGEIKMVEMAPPDVSGALAAKAIDAFSMGEPFPSQAEIAGYGRVLFQAREYWPDYMSCILVVRQDLIDSRPDVVQTLVDGIARSGLWLDKSKPNREDAADFVGRFYYRQKPALLRWALTKPMDRVIYSPLAPRKADFDHGSRFDDRDRGTEEEDRIQRLYRHTFFRWRDRRNRLEV